MLATRFHALDFGFQRLHLEEVTGLPIDDRVGLPAEALSALQTALGPQNTLQAAVRWALGRHYALLDVIDQDEFTRDVVFHMSADLYLVYDAT